MTNDHHDANRTGLPPDHRVYRRRRFLERVISRDGVEESEAEAFREARIVTTIQRENRKDK